MLTNYAGCVFILAVMFFPVLLHGLVRIVCHIAMPVRVDRYTTKSAQYASLYVEVSR